MLLKNHLIEVFKKASSENNFLLKENVVLKWVHRFGIDSLNDLLIHSPVQKENQTNCEPNYSKISNNNQVFNAKPDSNQINQFIKTPKSPLPNIKKLRKWINKDKKAS